MSERLKGFSVALAANIRDDDAEPIRQAIMMIRGVLGVYPIVANVDDLIIRQRVESELRQKLWDVFDNRVTRAAKPEDL